MTSYIVSGYIGFDNFGDEAIAKILTDKLKANDAENITLISSNPTKTAALYGVNSCGKFSFIKPLLKSDILISGGGSLLQDVTSRKSLLYYLSIIYLAILLGKKVIIFAQGIGPIKSKIGRILTKFALKHCYKISVRDKESQDYLKNWKINAKLVQDPVLTLELPKKNKIGTVGIQIRSFPTLNKKFLNRLANEICVRFPKYKIEVVSLQDSLDLDICNKFKHLLEQKGVKNVSVKSNLSVDEVFQTISEFEYLIGMRFHANVVGIKSGVKTLCINYDPKVTKLAKEFNLPIISLNQEDLSAAFEQLIK